MKVRRRFLLVAFSFAASIHAQNVGYVVDNSGGQVQVVNLATKTITATIPAGSDASELFILPSNQFGFVSNQGAQSVSLLDLRDNSLVTSIATGQGPGSLISTPDGRFLYVANDASNDVTVIDVVSRQRVKEIPVGATPVQVNLSPDGRFAYVVNQDETPTGTVSVIDTNRNEVVRTLAVGLQPNQFAILPNLDTAYVVNTGSNDVSLVDLVLNEVTGTVPVGQGPVSVAFSSDSRLLYVVNRQSNNISVVNTQQNREITKIPAGTSPVAMAVTFDSKFGFVSNWESNTVSLLDLTTNTHELDMAVGVAPFSLMLDPNEDFLYVTNLGSGSVSVIDVNKDRVVATVPTAGTPVQFTMLNAPTLLELAPNPALSGSRITLNGESLLAGSSVRFVTTSPPRTIAVPPDFLDSQGLQVTVPAFQGSAVVDVLHPDGNSSERLTLQVGLAAPAINPGGVVEAAGFKPAPAPISGNAIVAIFGNFPGLGDEVAATFPLPRTLANAVVTFNGVPAPIFGTSSMAGQINALAPVRLTAFQNVRVAVTISGQTSTVETVNVAPTSPGIFVISGDGAGAFLHADYSLVTAANPAGRSGSDPIAMFVTGLGNTAPPPLEGEGAPLDVLSYSTIDPAVTVDGLAANVRFSGLTPDTSGLYQINFDVPEGSRTGDNVPVVVTIDGRTSNSVKLAVK